MDLAANEFLLCRIPHLLIAFADKAKGGNAVLVELPAHEGSVLLGDTKAKSLHVIEICHNSVQLREDPLHAFLRHSGGKGIEL